MDKSGQKMWPRMASVVDTSMFDHIGLSGYSVGWQARPGGQHRVRQSPHPLPTFKPYGAHFVWLAGEGFVV